MATTVDSYIQAAPTQVQERLQALRNCIINAMPEGYEEIISYKMPTYRFKGNIIHFAYFKNHIGIYPGSDAIIHFKHALTEFNTSTGAFQWPFDSALPYKLIADIIEYNLSMKADKLISNWHNFKDHWIACDSLMYEILNDLPLEKTIKWGKEVYTYEGKNVIGWCGFKDFFAIWFYNGIMLQDPFQVLISASEGKTNSLRQWRFKSVDEMDPSKIKSYIIESIQAIQNGQYLKPAKKNPLKPCAII